MHESLRFTEAFDEYVLLSSAEHFFQRERLRGWTRVEDTWACEVLTRYFQRDLLGESSLRRLYLQRNGGSIPAWLSREQILDSILRELDGAFGRFVLLKRPRVQFRAAPAPASQRVSAQAAPAREPPHFFSLRLVDAASEQPVSSVRLELTQPDGARRALVTDREGVARLADVRPGSYGVSGVLKGATLAGTLVPAMGASATAGNTDGPPPELPRRPYTLLRVREHRVKRGDTLAQVAEAAGLTERELCVFNWGTTAHAEVQQRLRDEVGCTERDEEGRYVFDDEDEPGILYVPEAWTQEGLASNQRHTVRVYAVPRKLPELRFLFQINADAPEAKNDVLTLETEDGSWKHELPVSGLSEVEPDWVELLFPNVPTGVRFNLIQDPKDGIAPFYVFQSLSYGELREAQRQEESVDVA